MPSRHERWRGRDDGPVGNALVVLYLVTAGTSILTLLAGAFAGAERLAFSIAIPLFGVSVALAFAYWCVYGPAGDSEKIEVGEVVE